MERIDENGYSRGRPEKSDLISRQVAYEKIYLKNRDKYPLPFSSYVVHHRDRDKLNNGVKNLDIVTKEEHNEIHKLRLKGKQELEEYKKNNENQKLFSDKRLTNVNEEEYYLKKENYFRFDAKKRKRKKKIIFICILIGLIILIYLGLKENTPKNDYKDICKIVCINLQRVSLASPNINYKGYKISGNKTSLICICGDTEAWLNPIPTLEQVLDKKINTTIAIPRQFLK